MKLLSEAENFGAIDADNDSLLYKSFEDHKAFDEILKHKSFLIVGRKGAGKTAIFKKLLTLHDPQTFTFGHTFSDYPWHHHALQARVGIPDFDKYTHSWKYLILITLVKILLNQDQTIPFDETSLEASKRLEEFIVDTYGSRDPDVTQVFTPTKKLRLKPTFDIDIGLLKAGISPEAVPMDELPSVIPEVNRNLMNWLVDCMNSDNKYYIAFDQLDLGFNPDDDDYKNRLIGLVLAARDLNQHVGENEKQANITVFLRDDIYDNLHFEDKNKITENSVSVIEWDTDRSDANLKQLMNKRFTAVLGNLNEVVAWDDVFDETQEMPGHQTKYQHVIDRTYLRPRDIIRFTNTVLDRFKARASTDDANVDKFTNTDLHEARVDYSQYLRAELDDEIHKHFPDFERWLDLITSIGGWQFDIITFSKAATEREFIASPQEGIDVLEKLFFFSIIGFYRAGGRGFGGSEYVFRYQYPKTRFDPTTTLLRVHPGLIEALGLKRTTIRYDEDD